MVREFHLLARPIGLADAHDWFEFAAMREVRQDTSCGAIDRVSDLEAAIGRTLVQDPGAPVYFALRHEPSSGAGRDHRLSSRSVVQRNAEATSKVRPSCWGRGVATAVCRDAVQ